MNGKSTFASDQAGTAARSFRLGLLLSALMAAQVAAQPMPIDDFNAHLGMPGIPDGWSTIDSTVGARWGPATFDAGSGAFRLEGADLVPVGIPGGGFIASTWDASSDPMFFNGFVRATVRAETEGSIASLVLRTTGSLQTGFNTYLFGGSTGPDPEFFVSTIFGSQSIESRPLDPSLAFGVNEDWNIVAGTVGDQISMKVWRVGDPEPAAAQLVFTHRGFDSGAFGVESNLGGNFPRPARVSATFDDISFRPADASDVVKGLTDENSLWAAPMPVPQILLPPEFPQTSPQKSDFRGDVGTPADWPDLRITGRVTDLEGRPIPGLKFDFFHTDDKGEFGTADGTALRGHVFTDNDGNYELWTVTPGPFESVRPRLLHVFVGGENQGFHSPLYRTEMYFPEQFDNDIDGDGTPDKAYFDGVLSDLDTVGIEDDPFAPRALLGVGGQFSDLAANTLTINNDPLVDGFFDTTLDFAMPAAFQIPEPSGVILLVVGVLSLLVGKRLRSSCTR